MSAVANELTERAHGIAAWPFGRGRHCDARPDCLPDGCPWPRVRVLVMPGGDPDARQATLASVTGQDYPEAQFDDIGDQAAVGSIWNAAASDLRTAFLLVLRAGDLLAPGALTALCLEAVLSGVEAVAGLRVLFDHGVHALDLLDDVRTASASDVDAPFTGGEILISRQAVARSGGFDPDAECPMADLWNRLVANGVTVARIGRPVLLQHDPEGAARMGRNQPLSIVSLTGLGYGGGAGIAHRRLAEALALSGHRITHLRLDAESPAAAAEWTDRFPRTESAIREGGHDLVLAGNLHGATRSAGILGRLAQSLPVAMVLHDLFTLTGRCAHPKDCRVIETGCDRRCPSPTEYPQLARRRIAATFGEKQAVLAAARAPLLLANSDWTERRAHELAPSGARVARVSLAFPTAIFRPQDRAILRRRLGLPERDVLVLFSAVIADAPEKGFDDLVATMMRAARPGVGFVGVGRLDDPGVLGLKNVHVAGAVGDEASLAGWYGACDIHLTASRLETLGQVAIEAGLCGTPTVAYRATGLTSAVIHGVTGLLVEPEPGALAEGVEKLIADVALRRRLGAFARIVLESRYSHAAAAWSLHRSLAGNGAVSRLGGAARLQFTPQMLGHFAFAGERLAGAAGLVAAPSPPILRAMRRAKRVVFGHGMPLWMRRAAYGLALARRRPSVPVPRR